jgi:hypothetical protein
VGLEEASYDVNPSPGQSTEFDRFDTFFKKCHLFEIDRSGGSLPLTLLMCGHPYVRITARDGHGCERNHAGRSGVTWMVAEAPSFLRITETPGGFEVEALF